MANLNPNRGRELGKTRPALVIQADELTTVGAPIIVVLSMTRRVHSAFKRWRVTVPARERLIEDCQVVVVDQPRALDRDLFGDGPLTTLSPEELAAVDKSLKAVLDMF